MFTSTLGSHYLGLIGHTGIQGSQISYEPPTITTPALDLQDGENLLRTFYLFNVDLDQTGFGIKLGDTVGGLSAGRTLIEDVRVYYLSDAVRIESALNLTINNCEFLLNEQAVYTLGTMSIFEMTSTRMNDNTFYGVRNESSATYDMQSCSFEGNGKAGILTESGRMTLTSAYFENNTATQGQVTCGLATQVASFVMKDTIQYGNGRYIFDKVGYLKISGGFSPTGATFDLREGIGKQIIDIGHIDPTNTATYKPVITTNTDQLNMVMRPWFTTSFQQPYETDAFTVSAGVKTDISGGHGALFVTPTLGVLNTTQSTTAYIKMIGEDQIEFVANAGTGHYIDWTFEGDVKDIHAKRVSVVIAQTHLSTNSRDFWEAWVIHDGSTETKTYTGNETIGVTVSDLSNRMIFVTIPIDIESAGITTLEGVKVRQWVSNDALVGGEKIRVGMVSLYNGWGPYLAHSHNHRCHYDVGNILARTAQIKSDPIRRPDIPPASFVGDHSFEAHASDDTLTNTMADSYPKIHTNKGAGGLVTLTAPPATVGVHGKIRRVASQSFRLDPNGTDDLNDGVSKGSGKYAQLDTDGATLEYYCETAGELLVEVTGTVTYEP
jgi:hypothetical protein